MAITTDIGGERALQALIAWTSPAYPVGAFSYSHGLEAAIEDGDVATRAQLVDYVAAVIARGGGWVDAVLFVHAWRAAGAADTAALDEIAALALAFRGSSETALESRQMGTSFLSVTRECWPAPVLEAFAARRAGPVAHCIAGAVACAAHGVPLASALIAWLHATGANLISAGVRLVPLGQTDGQRAIAALATTVEEVAARAMVMPLDALATAAPLIELASMRHETQYTRLFRS